MRTNGVEVSDITPHAFREHLRASVLARSLFVSGQTLVVGVSGGADSLALLHALWALRSDLGISLHVAHLNHQLRGVASADDARFVAAIAESLGLPSHVAATDVRALRESLRLSLEEAARLARYRFFAHVIVDTRAAGVVVGHTADDQVETVVLNWLRGAGLAGLRGMQPATVLRVDDGEEKVHRICVLRPLLSLSRGDTEAYCRAVGLEFRVDESNVDPSYRRNRVRHDLLPQLESYNPRFREAALRMARLLGRDYGFITDEVRRHWSEVAEEHPDRVIVDVPRWLALPEALQGYVLRESAARLRGDLNGLSADHIERAASAMRRRATGKTIVWPRGLVVRVDAERAVVELAARAAPQLPVDPVPLAVPGQTELPGTGQSIEARLATDRCFGGDQSAWHVDLDYEKTGNALAVRRRRPGDRLRPLGLGHEKKLQDLLVDARVPRHERDAIPVVVADDRIVWVAGVRLDERFQVDEQTRTVLCLRVVGVGTEDTTEDGQAT